MHAIIHQHPSTYWQVQRLSSSIAQPLGIGLFYTALPDLRRLKKLWPWNLFTRSKPKNSFWFCMYWLCSEPSSLEDYLDLWTSIFKHQNWRINLIPVDLYFQKLRKWHTHRIPNNWKETTVQKVWYFCNGTISNNHMKMRNTRLSLPADYQDIQSPSDLRHSSHSYFHALLLELKYAISVLQRSLLNYKHNKKTRKTAIKRTETG